MRELRERGEIYFAMTRLIRKKKNTPFRICISCFGEIEYNQYFCHVVTYIPSDTISTEMRHYNLHKNCAKHIQEKPLRDIIREREEERKKQHEQNSV